MEPIIMRLFDENKNLLEKIEILKQEINNLNQKSLYQSEQLNELAPAFAKAKLDFKLVSKEGKTTNGWKYAKLNEILFAADAALAQHGLALYFYIVNAEGDARVLKTRILHASGQWIESFARIVPKANTHQAVGEAITYQKRYSAMCILGLAPSDDVTDDNGEADAIDDITKKTREGKKVDNSIMQIPINKTQLDEINYELEGYPDLAESMLKYLDIDAFADIKQSDFIAIMKRVRKIKSDIDSVSKK